MKKITAAIMMALAVMSFTACGLAGTGTAASNASGESAASGGLFGGGGWFWIIYIVIIVGFMYLMIIRPNRKQKKEQQNLYDSMAVGDSVLTTSGFYGTIIDLTEDTVIVEFGSNKNCRIPMQKAAIVQIEKPNYGTSDSEE